MKNHNLLLIVLFGLALITFSSSCISISEEIWAEADGSGKYSMTMDMSEAIELIQMAGEWEAEVSIDSTDSNDPMDELFGKILDGSFHGDTIINSNQIISDLKEKGEDVSSIPENFSMQLHYDTLKPAMFVKFLVEYNNLEEFKNSDFLNGDMSMFKGIAGSDSISMEGFYYTISDGIFNRKGMELQNSELFDRASPDELEMMSAMFPDNTYTTIIHLPGEVESTSNSKAVINGRTVTIEVPLSEMIQTQKLEELEIKFKK